MLLLPAALLALTAFPAPAPAASRSAGAREVLPFIHDDYARALSEARAHKLPLFIDTSAPWCHSCRSMEAFVFTDPALKPQADKFVWLAIDTEKPGNAALTKRLQIRAIPTYFILDPKDERVALRWVGGATVTQFNKILSDGRTAAGFGGGAGTDAAEAALARADRAYADGQNAQAAQAYQEALAAAPADWPRYSRAVESLLFAASSADSNLIAAKAARDAYSRLKKSSSAANVASSGLGAALALPAENPERKALVAELEADTREVVEDASLPIAADDRSGAYWTLIDARNDAKDEAGAKALTARLATFLEGAAASAGTPEGRAVFDSHRLGAYMDLGQADKAIPMLEASEKDFPDDYNPPARLAVAYKSLKRWDDALAASDRALRHAYGPRKLGILQTRADIYMGRSDVTSARKALEEAVALAQGLPPGQRSESTIGSLQKKLAGLPTQN